MGNQQFSVKNRSRGKVIPPSRYDVVFHNDDFTTMEFVIQVLQEVFFKNEIQAITLMMAVHRKGKAKVATYKYDVAISKKEKAEMRARQEGFPLKITVEPEELPF